MSGCQPIIIEQPHQCASPKGISGMSVLVGVLATTTAAFAAIAILQAADKSSGDTPGEQQYRKLQFDNSRAHAASEVEGWRLHATPTRSEKAQGDESNDE